MDAPVVHPGGEAGPTHPDAETRRIDAALCDWMSAAPAGFVRLAPARAECYGIAPAELGALERRFELLALELFAYQFERVPMYRAWSQACGRTPTSVRRAIDVPALPVTAFRRGRVASFAADREVAEFHTSGTTQQGPGILRLDTLALYDLALARGFKHHVIPDMDRIRMLLLVPPRREAPHSSLIYMLEHVRQLWGTPESANYMHGGDLEWRALREALRQAAVAGEAVCLLGTAFAYVQLLDACAAEGWSVRLPAGSRLFETGGYKGRGRELSRPELHRALAERLGIPAACIVSEYGMTELGSQYYTLSLRLAVMGDAVAAPPGTLIPAAPGVAAAPPPAGALAAASSRAGAPGTTNPFAPVTAAALPGSGAAGADQGEIWSAPFWLRGRILDSMTGEPRELRPGDEIGLLAHHDLANRGSVAHILGADLGEFAGASFVLRGRCPQADLRGCGLVYERSTGAAPVL